MVSGNEILTLYVYDSIISPLSFKNVQTLLLGDSLDHFAKASKAFIAIIYRYCSSRECCCCFGGIFASSSFDITFKRRYSTDKKELFINELLILFGRNTLSSIYFYMYLSICIVYRDSSL